MGFFFWGAVDLIFGAVDFSDGGAAKLSSLDLGNNGIGAKGAFYVAEFLKKSRSLQWLSLYMNDIGDEVRGRGHHSHPYSHDDKDIIESLSVALFSVSACSLYHA